MHRHVSAVWSLLIALVATYALLIAALYAVRPDAATLGQTLRLLPDLLRLVRRLGADRSLPRGVRIRLWLLLAYLACPIDLVPDVLPVVGYADDAILVAAVLRSVVRAAGADRVAHHWPGDPAGLAAVRRLAGIQPA
jgi:uncharacterized membrane protein YkvA (DUF1232 family)